MVASNAPTDGTGLGWLVFALMTVGCWGLYGVFLHTGQMGMEDANPAHGRYKAFLFVGLAYFLVAVLAPVALLLLGGAKWDFTAKGMTWSLLAGLVGAAGAFSVLLAFGAKGTPTVVMSIIFAGAPIVNALVAIVTHPPERGIGAIRWQFALGILLAALGGFLVTRYKPPPGKGKAQTSLTQSGPAPADG